MILILIFIALGLTTGILSSLLGIGGGVVTVPALYYLLLWSNFPPAELMQTAICTSLAATFVTSAGSTIVHHKNRAIWFRALAFLIPGLIIGCIFGAWLALYLSSELLRIVFGSAMIPLGGYFLLPKSSIFQLATAPNPLLILLGLIVGNLSSLLGIGGGVLIFPILLVFGAHLPQAAATSAASTLLSSFLGTLSYLYLFRDLTPLPGSFGFIHLAAFFSISAASLFTTQFGAKLIHRLPASLIRKIFGAALSITGIIMVFLGR